MRLKKNHGHTTHKPNINLTLLPIFRLTSPQEDECGNKENEVSCVSGDTLSNLDDSLGCRLIEVSFFLPLYPSISPLTPPPDS